MWETGIFKDLPVTFPEKDKYKKPSVVGSVIFHGLLILLVIVVPLLIPQSISERELLITLVSPVGPPPPPPPPPMEIPAVVVPETVTQQVRSVAPDVLVAPTATPETWRRLSKRPSRRQVG